MSSKFLLTTAAIAGVAIFALTRPVPDTSGLDRVPVVFVETGTQKCVAAFRRGPKNNPIGINCLAVKSELAEGRVIEKAVPQGTTFGEVLNEFLVADPWHDEFIARRDVSDG